MAPAGLDGRPAGHNAEVFMTRAAVAAAFLALCLPGPDSQAAGPSRHAGEEARGIRALSAAEVAGLLAGKGMGYAKAAELNGYPGPAHVLDLAGELDLTAAQRAETRAVFERMRESARELGAELVAAERALDRMFREGTIDESALAALVARIGRTEARLREVHLDAHLRQTELLSRRQVARYMTLRGYGTAGRGSHQRHHAE